MLDDAFRPRIARARRLERRQPHEFNAAARAAHAACLALDKSIDAAATDVQTAISAATGALPVDLPSPPSFSKA